ncbi:hypothetical protein NP493_369g02031 [Ridgeia piscesae]|uniref:Uncharacterized protein n=1 Tax=Ridgeia piscesae TaxID=27915 RepID=A0AAD9L3P5_RIDPI|nr:hypothetical protein NP493_369g02031 [Ridgeia piscesae]
MFRREVVFQEAQKKSPQLAFSCFRYIPDYAVIRQQLHDKGVSLVRMQNSAASCNIVSVMCLFAAAVIGSVGVWRKQVAAFMVTGVMYIVSGVFGSFSLIIIMTKVTYMATECYSLDPLDNDLICQSRTVSTGWSILTAWAAFGVFLVAFAGWLFLARILRIEKAKSMI